MAFNTLAETATASERNDLESDKMHTRGNDVCSMMCASVEVGCLKTEKQGHNPPLGQRQKQWGEETFTKKTRQLEKL